MGGNNPIVISKLSDIKVAVYNIILSSYLTAGQRCTACRRLIVIRSDQNQKFINELTMQIKKIKVDNIKDNNFMGPVISNHSADNILSRYQWYIDKGAKELVKMERLYSHLPYLTPGLIDITNIGEYPDEEIFGPLCSRVDNFDEAIAVANDTDYGLAASVFTTDELEFLKFSNTVNAGIINWNSPSTGASSKLPFGGIGNSGNFRPSAYYAADYCSYPVSSIQVEYMKEPDSFFPGIYD